MVLVSEATYNSCHEFLKEQLPKHFHNVRLGIICGSGLGGLVDTIDQSTKVEFHYSDIPGFVTSTGKKKTIFTFILFIYCYLMDEVLLLLLLLTLWIYIYIYYIKSQWSFR